MEEKREEEVASKAEHVQLMSYIFVSLWAVSRCECDVLAGL